MDAEEGHSQNAETDSVQSVQSTQAWEDDHSSLPMANIHISSDSDSYPGSLADGPTVNVNKLSTLYEKYSILCKEVERLETENGDYRERLLKSLRHTDQIDEKMKISESENKAKCEESDRRLLECDYQLKTLRDRSAAQEVQFKNMTADLTEKMNSTIAQLNKKLAVCEKEKNDAVIKYAMREAEVMRLKEASSAGAEQLRLVTADRDSLRESNSQKHLDHMTEERERTRTELAKVESDNNDLRNQLKLTEARIEAGQSTINTLKREMDLLKKQNSRLAEERDAVKDDHRHLMSQLQQIEQQSACDKEAARQFHEDKEELYKTVLNEMARLREQNQDYAKQLNDLENVRDELQEAVEKLKHEALEGALAMEKKDFELERLSGIEHSVNEALESASKATETRNEALQERDQAEREANECRKQAERMLEITERLTQKNADASAELESARAKNVEYESRIAEFEASESVIKSHNESLKRNLEDALNSSSSELSVLKRESVEQRELVKKLSSQVEELQSENVVIKKKNTSYIKELKAEVNSLRKQLAAKPTIEVRSPSEDSPMMNSNTLGLAEPQLGLNSSRASSITSIELLGRHQTEAQNHNVDSSVKSAISSASGQSTTAASSIVAVSPDDNVQQVMIEKIVKLQRQLARRQEKIEFLEDHVNQCIEELQNKTKIIQSYALREEASLLLPADDALDKIPLARKGTTHSLFGSAFSYGSDKKASVDLATEINSRLQAVLEDTLLKNITLKTNLDTLGEEISRLSRENRQLSLMK